MSQITIALSKGRILQDSLPLLKAAGIELKEQPDKTRKLLLPTTADDVRIVILRATDVPTYVEYGAADIGIAGKDVLMEYGGDRLYEPIDLNIARCRLMIAGRADDYADFPQDATATALNFARHRAKLRIATKYINVTKAYFAEQAVPVEVIKLYGSMELGPLVGLSDLIVDVVDTGKTLKANGLKPLINIADISSRLIVNKASLKMKHQRLKPLMKTLQQAVVE